MEVALTCGAEARQRPVFTKDRHSLLMTDTHLVWINTQTAETHAVKRGDTEIIASSNGRLAFLDRAGLIEFQSSGEKYFVGPGASFLDMHFDNKHIFVLKMNFDDRLGTSAEMVRVCLSTGDVKSGFCLFHTAQRCTKKPGMRQSKTHLLVCMGSTLFVVEKATGTAVSTLEADGDVTAIDITERALLFGDMRGMVTIVHSLCHGKRSVLNVRNRTNHHWHCSEVTAAVFMDDENYFVSGGREGTLVMWNASQETNAKKQNKRQYVPRLGGISEIALSPDKGTLVVVTENEKTVLVDIGSFCVDAEIRLLSRNIMAVSEGLLFSATKEQGIIQAYSPKKNKNVALLDICGYNNTFIVGCEPQAKTEITALLIDGENMFSAEKTENGAVLRMWSLKNGELCFLDSADSPGAITEIKRTRNIVATIDTQSNICIWEACERLWLRTKKKYRERTVQSLAVNPNGLAVVSLHEGRLVFWRLEEMKLLLEHVLALFEPCLGKVEYLDEKTVGCVGEAGLVLVDEDEKRIAKTIKAICYDFAVYGESVFGIACDGSSFVKAAWKVGDDTIEEFSLERCRHARKLFLVGKERAPELCFVGDDVCFYGQAMEDAQEQAGEHVEKKEVARALAEQEIAFDLAKWNAGNKTTKSLELENCLEMGRRFFELLINNV
eukprot:GHVN01100376.1.p1 GENE.GHVN01100376.1~~GHVN01100376.1.p1  ORF type:complete len:665 (+),score=72.86 GHVN01100376.1:2457-4451(+)